MYIPQDYKNENLKEVKEFIINNSFGILINHINGKPWATHIPLELDKDSNGNDILVGHIAKANPQWKYFVKDKDVLCIFNGPNTYVSSSWYAEEEVPTWNYIAVHIYGLLKVQDKKALMASLHKLVDKYERKSENPMSLNNLSKNTLRQVNGIIGFEIEIKEIQAAYKLSQGREHDHPKIIEELEKRDTGGGHAIVEAMKKSTSKKDLNK
jgi:transcriptional regulator